MTDDTLLIPTDGSDPAEAAATNSIALAAHLDVTVHVLSDGDETRGYGPTNSNRSEIQ